MAVLRTLGLVGIVCIVWLTLGAVHSVFGGDPAIPGPDVLGSPAPVAPPAGVAAAPAWVLNLFAQHAWLATLALVVGLIRPFGKGFSTFVHTVVRGTPTKWDDDLLERIESSAWLKWALVALDYVASIKLVHPDASLNGPVATLPSRVPLALLLAAAGMMIGCSSVKQTAKWTETDPTTGITVQRELQTAVMGWGDSKNAVEKLRSSNGKTLSLGAAGVSEETSSAGMVELIKGVYEAGKSAAKP